MYKNLYQKKNSLIKQISEIKLKIESYHQSDVLTQTARDRLLKHVRKLKELVTELEWTLKKMNQTEKQK